jgi:predicted CopG family antitoxin
MRSVELTKDQIQLLVRLLKAEESSVRELIAKLNSYDKPSYYAIYPGHLSDEEIEALKEQARGEFDE